jgi:hypothetical protein
LKLWQLFSVARIDKGLVGRVAASRPSWKPYELAAENFDGLVQTQNRAVLDAIVEQEFAVAVLGQLRSNLYLSSDGWLRSRRHDVSDQEISVLEAYERYGGNAIEEAYERGSVNIK